MVCIFKGVLIIGLIYLERVDGDILLKDNRYDGTVVAIDKSVPEDENLLAKLKVSLQEASEVLFQATRKQVYFGTILIQLPQTWTTLTSQLTEHHQYVTGDIIIDSPPKYHGDRPFTMQPLGCGIPGDFTILPPEFLTQPDPTYGPIAKILVHEWGHLRFGLFDEYPVKDSQNFYTDPDGKVTATKCPAFLTGEIKNDNGGNCLSPNDACVYTDHQQTGSYASLMYKTNLEHVNQFCDNDTENEATLHNVDAPTEQNALCERKAAWQVLQEHADFVGDNSTLNEAPPINFIEYKIQRERTVVVMDVSGSMGDKIDKMSKAVRKYLSTVVRDGEEVGLVKFSSKSQTEKLHELTAVSVATRKSLTAAVPTIVGGSTCIGCGIEVALDMLNPGKSLNNKGGTMIILSDGEENRVPRIYEMHDEVLKQEVIVHSIALTQSASSNLDALAIDTKGRTFIYDFNEESNALNEAFETLSELHTDPHDKNIQLQSKIYSVDQVRGDNIVIDQTIGRGTKFIFDYEGAAIHFVLTSPTGVQYTQDDADHSDSHIYVISMGDEIQNGLWRYSIMNKDSSATRVVVTVTSKASNPERPPIIAHPFWSHRDGLPRIGVHNPDIPVLFARVSQGYSPVIGATVVAYITDPNGKVHEAIPLTDNGGSDFDTHKDDGIYGTYFKAYDGIGRYGVRIWVVGDGEKTVIDHRRIIGRGAPSNETDDDSEKETTGMFTRFASAGAYDVKTIPEKYPPGRIKSLSLVGVDPSKQILVLTWLATGSELNFGIASHYVIRYSTTVSQLQDDFESQSKVEQEHILLGQLNQPKTSGTLETFILRFPNVEISTVFYAVVAYDTDGRVVNSGVSNVISVLLTSPQFIPPTIAPILNPPNPPAPAPGYQQPNDPQNHNDPEIPVHASTPAPTNGTATQGNTTSTTPGTNATSQSVNKGPTVAEQAMMIGIPLLVVTLIFSVVLYIIHMKNKRPITPKSDMSVSLSDTEEAIEEKNTSDDSQEGTSKSIPVCVVEPDNGVDIGIVKVKPACVIAVDTDNDKVALKGKYVHEVGDLSTHFQTPPAPTYLPKAKTLYKDQG